MTCDDCKHYLEEIKHILTNKETVTGIRKTQLSYLKKKLTVKTDIDLLKQFKSFLHWIHNNVHLKKKNIDCMWYEKNQLFIFDINTIISIDKFLKKTSTGQHFCSD